VKRGTFGIVWCTCLVEGERTCARGKGVTSIVGERCIHRRHKQREHKAHHSKEKTYSIGQASYLGTEISISGTKGKGTHYCTRGAFPKNKSIVELDMS
jgi:hypothetical protein